MRYHAHRWAIAVAATLALGLFAGKTEIAQAQEPAPVKIGFVTFLYRAGRRAVRHPGPQRR